MAKEKAKQKAPTKKTKVCIVGCADSKNRAPFHDKTYEFWGVNNLFLTYPDKPWSRWFEIHYIHKDTSGGWLRRYKTEFRGQSVGDYLKTIGKMTIPVYMQRKWDEVPTSVVYPLDKVVRMFCQVNGWFNMYDINDDGDIDLNYPDIVRFSTKTGQTNQPRVITKPYFTNTISYMLALAIIEGFKEIQVVGVDMAVGSEYENQRSSCELLLGWAAGMGIKVYVPPDADLLKTRHIYAFEEPQENDWEMKKKSNLKAMSQRREQASIKMHGFLELKTKLDGGTEALKKFADDMKVAGVPIDPRMKEWLDTHIAGNKQASRQNEIQYKQAQAEINQYLGGEHAIKEMDKIWSLPGGDAEVKEKKKSAA